MSTQRVAVITGAGRGIGRATAVHFAKAGWDVAACARSGGELSETESTVRDAGRRTHFQTLDVSDADAVNAFAQDAARTLGRIDLWVNNAGLGTKAAITDMDRADFDALIAVNVNGVFYGTQAAWPIMKAQGGGVIVNISSFAAVDPFPGFSAYGGTKAWVNLFTKAAGDEGRADNICVFAIALGAVDTPLLRRVVPEVPEDARLDPDAVAGMIEQLTDARSAPASGTVLFARK